MSQTDKKALIPSGFHIAHNPKPIPNRSFDWDITHDSWDERIEFAPTQADAITLIHEIIEEEHTP